MMTGTLYLRPLDISRAPARTSGSLPLAGGPLRFAACEVALRGPAGTVEREVVPVASLTAWAEARGAAAAGEVEAGLARLTAARPPFAGLGLERPRLMGVVNVTPDSFSDGGDRFDHGRAVDDGLAMLEAGADLVDVGGESTRPGADAVAVAEELRRVVPVVRALAAQGAKVSIDTRRAAVMTEALAAGASLVNDVTALAGDPDSLALVREAGVPVVLMHMRGEPRTMQLDPVYDDAALDVYDYLAGRVEACEAAGIARARIAIDPGIGFGKTVAHNLEILERLGLFHGLGCPVLLGVSRKSFIGRLSRAEPPKQRIPGSLAAALAGIERGVQILRVHDVGETLQALDVWRAIAAAAPTDLAEAG